MTKAERDALRARCQNKIANWKDICLDPKDALSMLDRIEELEAALLYANDKMKEALADLERTKKWAYGAPWEG